MNFVTFNQDYSCLAVGTRNGYRIYNCDPFGKCYEHKGNDIAIIEMLFSTSLVAIILSPRQLRITNTKVRTSQMNFVMVFKIKELTLGGASTEAIYNMRAHLPNQRACSPAQQETVDRRSRGTDIFVRY